jgi:hypothetical protein
VFSQVIDIMIVHTPTTKEEPMKLSPAGGGIDEEVVLPPLCPGVKRLLYPSDYQP